MYGGGGGGKGGVRSPRTKSKLLVKSPSFEEEGENYSYVSESFL